MSDAIAIIINAGLAKDKWLAFCEDARANQFVIGVMDNKIGISKNSEKKFLEFIEKRGLSDLIQLQ